MENKSTKNIIGKAKAMPKNTVEEKEIRSDAVKNARTKKRSATLLKKYSADKIMVPDEAVKEEIINRDAANFFESLKIRRELSAYLKAVSIYNAVVKPYNDARDIITQSENYTHYDELEKRYFQLCEARNTAD